MGDDYFHLNNGRSLPEITMPATIVGNGANNWMWISCSNTSQSMSCFPAFVVRPDGVTVGRLERDKADILIMTIDLNQNYYDSSGAWRRRCMEGIYHSGTISSHPRSKDRQGL